MIRTAQRVGCLPLIDEVCYTLIALLIVFGIGWRCMGGRGRIIADEQRPSWLPVDQAAQAM